MRRNPSRRGRKAELFTSIDLDSRKNSSPYELRLRRCRFLPGTPASPAVVPSSSGAQPGGGRRERKDLLVSSEPREEVEESDGVESGDMCTKVGFRGKKKVLAKKRGRVGGDVCVLNIGYDDFGVDEGNEKAAAAQKGFLELDKSQTGNAEVANGYRPIDEQRSESKYGKDRILNTGCDDMGVEKGSETSTSAQEGFLELDDPQIGNAEVANGNRALGDQCTEAGCGIDAEGDPKPVLSAMRKLPPSILDSSGEKGSTESTRNSRFFNPLLEKQIKNHDSSGSGSYITAPCDHDMSQENIFDSASSVNLYDVIKAFSRRRDRRLGKGDILTTAAENGINFPPPRWWRPGGYGAEEPKHNKGKLS